MHNKETEKGEGENRSGQISRGRQGGVEKGVGENRKRWRKERDRDDKTKECREEYLECEVRRQEGGDRSERCRNRKGGRRRVSKERGKEKNKVERRKGTGKERTGTGERVR